MAPELTKLPAKFLLFAWILCSVLPTKINQWVTETSDNLSLIKQQDISSLVTIIVSSENSNFLAPFASEMEDVESP